MSPTANNDREPEIPIEIRADEAFARRRGNGLWFLDVREPFERDICHLEPDGFIPLGEIARRWREVPTDREIVVYCHHGMRSLKAARFLRERGVALVRSLRGGTDEWSVRIDPSVSRY